MRVVPTLTPQYRTVQVLALQDPRIGKDVGNETTIVVFDVVFAVIFTMEFAVKVSCWLLPAVRL